MNMFESLKLSDLPKNNGGLLRHPSNTRPAIWAVKENGVRAVVKDFSHCKFLYRNIIGRFLIWRESKAYRRLRGLRGVPTLYRVIDGLALVIEEIPGGALKRHAKETRLSTAFFDQLQKTTNSFHRRGLAHCDLKHVSNVLLGHDGMPYIVDWAASISKREFTFFPLSLIYRRFVLDDQLAIIKVKLQHVPETLTLEERRRYDHRSNAEKKVRAVRDKLQKALQKMA